MVGCVPDCGWQRLRKRGFDYAVVETTRLELSVCILETMAIETGGRAVWREAKERIQLRNQSG
jgi:hypothetical protein